MVYHNVHCYTVVYLNQHNSRPITKTANHVSKSWVASGWGQERKMRQGWGSTNVACGLYLELQCHVEKMTRWQSLPRIPSAHHVTSVCPDSREIKLTSGATSGVLPWSFPLPHGYCAGGQNGAFAICEVSHLALIYFKTNTVYFILHCHSPFSHFILSLKMKVLITVPGIFLWDVTIGLPFDPKRLWIMYAEIDFSILNNKIQSGTMHLTFMDSS